MLVVWQQRQDNSPAAGTSLPTLQPIVRAAENPMENAGKSNWVESRPMPTRASF